MKRTGTASTRHPLLALLAKWAADSPLGDETALVSDLDARRRESPVRFHIPSIGPTLGDRLSPPEIK